MLDRPTEPRDGDVVLLVGTPKGAFLLWSHAGRREWRMEGPHFCGEQVYALAMDQRGGRRPPDCEPGLFRWGVEAARERNPQTHPRPQMTPEEVAAV